MSNRPIFSYLMMGTPFEDSQIQNALAVFVTPRNVEDVLKDAGVHDARRLAKFVLNDAKKLFLILVMMTGLENEKISLLADLKRSNISDASLPIQFHYDRVEGPYHWSSLERSAEKRFEFVGNWDRRDRDLLAETYQWHFLAPVFGDDTFRFDFHPRRILPYLYAEPRAASSGFFGEVSRNVIHKAHVPSSHTDANGEGIAIAIKKAKHDDELEEFFDKEASNLHKLQQYKSPHLIKPIAAYQIGQDRCLIFPWANGGNLLNYWKDHQDQRLNLSSLQWLLRQLKGVCSAIQELHEENARHGDLKPENILWFEDGNDGGFLQIADLGLAAFHEKEAHTQNRKGMKTFTPSGTSRYEPPEMDEKRNTDDPRSRQYDMWSMGCVLLEALLWLIYGFKSVGVFQGSTTHFWVCHNRPDGKEYFVHPYVDSCMRVMMADLQGESAYKDLLFLVQKRLLVVAVSETYGSFPGCREIAKTLHTAVEKISEKSATLQGYLAPVALEYPADRIREQQQHNVVHQEGGNLAAPRREDVPSSPPILITHDAPSIDGNGGVKVLVRAPTGDFNSSASLSTNSSANTKHKQNVSGSPPLCIRTHTLFIPQLKTGVPSCTGIPQSPRVITLSQDGGTVGIKHGPKLLSIYVEPGSDPPEGAQLGLPKVLEPASPEQFTLLKQWIEVCDLSHEMCRRKDGDVPTMPTRLIEVGDPIRLVDSARIDPSPYIALSHCWGPLTDNAKFCTFKYNVDQLRKSIDFERLPLTFKDAVSVVRGLGFRYIWIDSLCIIQDDQRDWEYEAARMEQVFSGAYFTIAASSAKSSNEGFLLPRKPRPRLQLSAQGPRQLYACPNIDNFHKDVELGELNRRGWVLQERVLSRRSIHFSTSQIYWECGAGVRCETLTRLHNSKVAFLGDANFPESALEYYRDGRQVLVQDLYERYSGLAFTMAIDRSVAILGLQKRLERAFQTQAAFGLFAVYFGRGLLWQRRDIQPMKRIAWPGGRRVPSWSWFSKEGPIKYMSLQFEKIDWATKEFRSPFQRQTAVGLKKPSDAREDRDITALRGRARKLHLTKLEMLVRIRFDSEEEFDIDRLRCVVIGRDKIDHGTDDPKQHVLVVQPLDALEKRCYERVGVASLSIYVDYITAGEVLLDVLAAS
ncbi:hypothetical protein DL770_000931 [Monosporascus sp. CRB-9-2]|nr:hypothetical protein DL770_000931 [Monosporascus sp. CRB-9-2]